MVSSIFQVSIHAVFRFSGFVFTFLSFGYYSIHSRIEPNECIEFIENPMYREITLEPHFARHGRQTEVPEVFRRYRLVHVHPQEPWGEERKAPDLTEVWQAAPILFVPGHSGSFNQSKTIAAQIYAEAGSNKISIFALDMREDLSALSGFLLQAQSEFINDAVQHILWHYRKNVEKFKGHTPKSVLLVGHSMGGVAARGAVVAKNHIAGTIVTIITLNSPHQAISPVMSDSRMLRFYESINQRWKSEVHTRDVIVISVAGGRRDTTIRSDLTSLNGLVDDQNALHVYTGSIPGVWLQNDHDSIVWCGQLIIMLSRTLLDLLDTTTRQFKDSKVDRLQLVSKRLWGRDSRESMMSEPNATLEKLGVFSPMVKSKFIHVCQKKFSQEATYSCMNMPQLKAAQKSSQENAFILLSNMSISDGEITLSGCANVGCESSSCSPIDVNSKFDFLPNGDRRIHLHHSYDPNMKPGQRHFHRWSRATAKELLSNDNSFKFGGALQYVFLNHVELEKFKSLSVKATSSAAKTIDFALLQAIPKPSIFGKEDTRRRHWPPFNMFSSASKYIAPGHSAVLDISNFVSLYGLFLSPFIMYVEKIACGNIDERSVPESKTSTLGDTELFKPILRIAYFNSSKKPYSLLEESITTLRPVIDGHSERVGTSSFFIQGFPGVYDNAIVVQLFSDPRCSYRLERSMDWKSIPAIFIQYMFPRLLSCPYAVYILLFAIQMREFHGQPKSEAKRFPSFLTSIGKFGAVIILFCTALLAFRVHCVPAEVLGLIERPSSVLANEFTSVPLYFVLVMLSVGLMCIYYILVRFMQIAMKMVMMMYIHTAVDIPKECSRRKRSRSNLEKDNENNTDKPLDDEDEARLALKIKLAKLIKAFMVLILLLLWPILTIACLSLVRLCLQSYDHIIRYGLSVLSSIRETRHLSPAKLSFNLVALPETETDTDNFFFVQMLILLHFTFVMTQCSSVILNLDFLFTPDDFISFDFFESICLFPSAYLLLPGQVKLSPQLCANSSYALGVIAAVNLIFFLDRLDCIWYVHAVIHLLILWPHLRVSQSDHFSGWGGGGKTLKVRSI